MRAVLTLMLIAAPLVAQNPAVRMARENWLESQDYILRSAEQMPESLYKFKPTPAVRSFGEILAHVAGSEYFYCAAALGERGRDEDEIMRTATTKAAIVQAVKDAGTYCARAYAMTDAAAAAAAANVGENHSRLYALIANFGHNMEHYGNLITYFRINGMVPPSSQPSR
jgi:uncharacterized damage-inducible protein DinB